MPTVLPFGETVLLWRLDRGLTQAELARAADISRPNLSAIERGQREVTLKTLRALAEALGVRPGQLADGESPHATTKALSREALERIAQAATSPTAPANAHERALAADLRRILERQRGALASDRAYLRLKAMVSPEVVASLVARASGQPRKS